MQNNCINFLYFDDYKYTKNHENEPEALFTENYRIKPKSNY